jgi:hypothetical protein
MESPSRDLRGDKIDSVRMGADWTTLSLMSLSVDQARANLKLWLADLDALKSHAMTGYSELATVHGCVECGAPRGAGCRSGVR